MTAFNSPALVSKINVEIDGGRKYSVATPGPVPQDERTEIPSLRKLSAGQAEFTGPLKRMKNIMFKFSGEDDSNACDADELWRRAFASPFLNDTAPVHLQAVAGAPGVGFVKVICVASVAQAAAGPQRVKSKNRSKLEVC
jgi:hypothetical protein